MIRRGLDRSPRPIGWFRRKPHGEEIGWVRSECAYCGQEARRIARGLFRKPFRSRARMRKRHQESPAKTHLARELEETTGCSTAPGASPSENRDMRRFLCNWECAQPGGFRGARFRGLKGVSRSEGSGAILEQVKGVRRLLSPSRARWQERPAPFLSRGRGRVSTSACGVAAATSDRRLHPEPQGAVSSTRFTPLSRGDLTTGRHPSPTTARTLVSEYELNIRDLRSINSGTDVKPGA